MKSPSSRIARRRPLSGSLPQKVRKSWAPRKSLLGLPPLRTQPSPGPDAVRSVTLQIKEALRQKERSKLKNKAGKEKGSILKKGFLGEQSLTESIKDIHEGREVSLGQVLVASQIGPQRSSIKPTSKPSLNSIPDTHPTHNYGIRNSKVLVKSRVEITSRQEIEGALANNSCICIQQDPKRAGKSPHKFRTKKPSIEAKSQETSLKPLQRSKISGGEEFEQSSPKISFFFKKGQRPQQPALPPLSSQSKTLKALRYAPYLLNQGLKG